jgi:acyl-CoA dehydrogenase
MRQAFFFDLEHERLAHHLDAFVPAEIDPLLEQPLSEAEQSREAVRRLGRAGLLEYTVPEEQGGRHVDLDSRALCLIREALGYASSLVDTAFAMQGLGSYPITLAGDAAQKAAWLPPVGRGEAIPAFAITEPDAGSDVASLTTRAVRDGDTYRLTGVKRFISNAGIADYYVVFARTGDAGSRGITAFVVEADRPGLVIRPLEVIAPHPIGEVYLHDCAIPAANRLGDEGAGFQIAMRTLDRFRPTVGAAALGMGRRALDEALAYTTTRRQFGSELSEHQATRMKLADMATGLEAARLLVFQAAWLKDRTGERVTREAAMAKLYATEAAQRAIDEAVQLHGGNGVLRGSVVERLYREIRALRIYEGTSEIQRLVIAGSLLKERRAARD